MKRSSYKRYKAFILSCMIFLISSTGFAQNELIDISSKVLDEAGKPIAGATISSKKGKSVETDNDGAFSIQVERNSMLNIVKPGYESTELKATNIGGQIILTASTFLATRDDELKLGIKTVYQRDEVGSVSKINPADRLTYDNTNWVRDYIQGLMPGVRGSDNIRGLGTALFVIDGVIGRSPDMLNMDEIEQITLLKDATSVAMYGSQARNGVIVINTKRGKLNKKESNVNVRFGVKTPISVPTYLGSADYMELNNEALINDGKKVKYSEEDIEAFRSSTNPYRYPDVNFYSEEYLKPFTQFSDVNAQFTDGTDKAQYYVSLGWNHSESMEKINPSANAGSNRFNVRGNIDFRVNNYITSSIDAVAIISSDRSALANLYYEGQFIKPNDYSPLFPVSMIDTVGNQMLAAQLLALNTYDGMVLGGSQQFKEDNPVARAIAGGYQNSMFKSTQFNNAVNFDLDFITEGLSAKTYLSFDFYDAYRLSINNQFKVYEPAWTGDTITRLTPYGDADRKDLTESVSTNGFVSRVGFYGLLNYEKTFNVNHSFNTTLLGYMNSMKQNNVMQTDRSAHLGLQATYDFKKKIYADVSTVYVYSIKLPEGNRGALAPTFGLGYILSEEDFLKGSNVLNYLKLKATGGVIKSDIGINEYYLYNETYSTGDWVGWADGEGSSRTKDVSQGGNAKMTFESRIDLNLGLEAYLFNSLWLEFNAFKTDMDKQLSTIDVKYPSYFTAFRPYDNYNKDTYSGAEFAANFNKQFGDFSLSVGANALYSVSEITKRDEVYEFEHQYRVGTSVTALYGLMDEGFYTEDDLTLVGREYVLNEGLPVPAYGAVSPGDIKYVDYTGDGVIDNNDRVIIGNWSSPFSYGINLKLNYKSLTLFVLGVGQNGGEGIKSNDYYWVDGNDKYSEVVLGRWTPETAETATFPRLTTKASRNNFQTSTFWMYDNSYFDIKRAQLTYEFSEKICKKLKMKKVSMNVAGVNIFRFAENKDVQQLSLGYNPQFSYWTVGLRTTF